MSEEHKQKYGKNKNKTQEKCRYEKFIFLSCIV